MKDRLRIISGTAHPALAAAIAESAGVALTPCRLGRFGDGELDVQIGANVRGCHVFIVQPTSPDADKNLMEILVICDALRRASAREITVVMPYYGYARKDRKDQPRVPITAKLVANLLVAAGANRILTMELHAAQIQGFFDIPVDHLESMPVLVPAIRRLGLERFVVSSADVGGIKRAEQWSEALGVGFVIVAKHRLTDTEVKAERVIGDVDGYDVVLVDDLTNSAGTLVAASNLLRQNGARRIFAGVAHGVLVPLGRERLDGSSIEKVLTTDSVPQAFGPRLETVSVAELFGKAISRIYAEESVTELFHVPGTNVHA